AAFARHPLVWWLAYSCFFRIGGLSGACASLQHYANHFNDSDRLIPNLRKCQLGVVSFRSNPKIPRCPVLLSPEQFIGFLLADMMITISPGPDNLMVLGVGISRGRRQGMAFGLGCALGCLNHTVLATVGISALIAASPVAFITLKVCGGLYLIW